MQQTTHVYLEQSLKLVEIYQHSPIFIYTYMHTLLTVNSVSISLVERKTTEFRCHNCQVRNKVWKDSYVFSSVHLKTLVANDLASAHQILALFWDEKIRFKGLASQQCYIFHSLTEQPVLLCKTTTRWMTKQKRRVLQWMTMAPSPHTRRIAKLSILIFN